MRSNQCKVYLTGFVIPLVKEYMIMAAKTVIRLAFVSPIVYFQILPGMLIAQLVISRYLWIIEVENWTGIHGIILAPETKS